VTSAQLCKQWISGTDASILAHNLVMMSLLSQMIRPHFLVSSYMACIPPPMLTIALSHLPLVVASAACNKVLHSSSDKTPSRMTAHASSFSTIPAFLKSTLDLVKLGAGPCRKSSGSVNVEGGGLGSMGFRR
jgi:hypothetical protein